MALCCMSSSSLFLMLPNTQIFTFEEPLYLMLLFEKLITVNQSNGKLFLYTVITLINLLYNFFPFQPGHQFKTQRYLIYMLNVERQKCVIPLGLGQVA